MENIYSKGKDVAWLAQQLKNIMGGYVSFNRFGLENPVLTGKYCKNGFGGGQYSSPDNLRFFIKFCKDEFLRIQIPISYKKDAEIAMEELINALSKINCNGKELGFPLAIYETNESLTTEYAFNRVDEIIKALQDGTMFDDGEISNLCFFGTCANCAFGSFGLDCNSGEETLYCTESKYEYATGKNNTCSNHQYIDGLKPDLLCKKLVKTQE